MSLNKSLNEAKRQKNDDFYTQLPDIENELKHYRPHFAGKVIYCNCDDPKISNFYKYFSLNFEALGLKKLITTCYRNKALDLFSKQDSENAIWLECGQGAYEKGAYIPSDPIVRHLDGNGDFRSPECVELLKQADIIVTNPPFSLFREYVAQIMEYDKKFIVIGNVNAITYKEIAPLIRENKMWLGPSIKSGDREFGVPDHYPLTAASHRIDDVGRKYVRIKGVRWFTNLDHEKRHEDLFLYKTYSPEAYPHYDNYDAINVNKTNDIPKDWDGVMGVPITFLDKYNPEQFEIMGITDRDDRYGLKTKKYTLADASNYNDLNGEGGVIKVGGKYRRTYRRLLVRRVLPQ